MESFDIEGLTVTIEQDAFPDNPRDWDNLGQMACFHKRHNLGDKHDYKQADYTSWGELREAIEKDHPNCVILPLYLMDHSGLRMSTGPAQFRACDSHGWDWGQVGFIFAPLDAISKEVPSDASPEEVGRRGEEILRGEVETYDQYISGEVYQMIIKDEDGNVLDSCGSLFGFEYAREYATDTAKNIARSLITANYGVAI